MIIGCWCVVEDCGCKCSIFVNGYWCQIDLIGDIIYGIDMVGCCFGIGINFDCVSGVYFNICCVQVKFLCIGYVADGIYYNICIDCVIVFQMYLFGIIVQCFDFGEDGVCDDFDVRSFDFFVYMCVYICIEIV